MNLKKDIKTTLSRNLLQNVASLLLRPDCILLIKFNNEVYYVLSEYYFVNESSFKSSYIFDLRDNSETFVDVYQIQDILNGNSTKRKSTWYGRDKDLHITAEDFYKLRLLVNEKIE